MNKIFSITAVMALCFSFISNVSAQKELKEGVITMELTEVKADDPAMQAQLQMMKGSSTVVAFDEKKSVVKMEMMGGMMGMTIVTSNEDKTGFLLFDMSMVGMKNKVNINAEDVAKQKETEAANDMEVTYDKSDTKEIAGYKCFKATISSPDMQGSTITAYLTDEIKIKADVIQGISADKIDGFPLEYSIGGPGMSMIYTTTDVKFEVDDSMLNVNTEGFEEMSMEEFQNKMKAFGGGGMGF